MSSQSPDPLATFGPNEWLVDDLYQQYLKDKNSVDKAWWSFFADYRPDGGGPAFGAESEGATSSNGASSNAKSSNGASNGTAAKGASNGSPANAATPASHTPSGPSAADTPAAVGQDAPATPAAGPGGPAGAGSGGDAAAKPIADADQAPTPVKEVAAERSKARAKAPSRDPKPDGRPDADHAANGHQAHGSPDPSEAELSNIQPIARDTVNDKVPEAEPVQDTRTPLRGVSARIVTNMEASLDVPTATSVRAVPAKLLIDNRTVINNHLARSRGGKVSFTHLIGYRHRAGPAASTTRDERGVRVEDVNGTGQAGHRPSRRARRTSAWRSTSSRRRRQRARSWCQHQATPSTLELRAFWGAYEDIVRRKGADRQAHHRRLRRHDGQSHQPRNGIGTVHSVPRLMPGQGASSVSARWNTPPTYGRVPAWITLAGPTAVSKTITLTSTYDHRVIQGAQSGDLPATSYSELLLGEDDFYDDIFASLQGAVRAGALDHVDIPDMPATDDDLDKRHAQAGTRTLIHAYRVRGHLMADTDPLDVRSLRTPPELDVTDPRADHLGPGPRPSPPAGFAGPRRSSSCAKILGRAARLLLPHPRHRVHAHPGPRAAPMDPGAGRGRPAAAPRIRRSSCTILDRLNAAEAFENASCRPSTSARSASALEGGESAIVDSGHEILSHAAEDALDEVVIGMPHRGRLNVLANIVGKSYRADLRGVRGQPQDPEVGTGLRAT